MNFTVDVRVMVIESVERMEKRERMVQQKVRKKKIYT